MVEAELGAPLGARYAEFDREPFAAPLPAQVYRARLPDGRQVAVKVRRPGIRVQVERGLALLTTLARRFERHQPGAVAFRPSDEVAKLAQYTRRELDFRREARGQRARAPSRYSLAQRTMLEACRAPAAVIGIRRRRVGWDPPQPCRRGWLRIVEYRLLGQDRSVAVGVVG